MERSSGGTVTLVFTDIEGSTRLLERLGDDYATLIADHHRIVDGAAVRHGGTRIDAAGDGLFMSFPTARGALDYDPLSRTAVVGALRPTEGDPLVAVVTAGTSDLPVGREALRTLAFYGVPAREMRSTAACASRTTSYTCRCSAEKVPLTGTLRVTSAA